MRPLNQNKEFYNRFIKYILEKDGNIKIFKRALNYIEDIETFLFVIKEYKERIYHKYEELIFSPIKIKARLKLIKYTQEIRNLIDKEDNYDDNESEELDEYIGVVNECDNIIKSIEDIIKFSEKGRILVLYIDSIFWRNLIKNYDIIDLGNIANLH